MSKHTEGPWSVDPTGRVVLDDPRTRNPVAVTVTGDGISDDEAAANARLIAAAPALLSALRDILEWADRAGCSEAFQRDARAALAQAEGGAHDA